MPTDPNHSFEVQLLDPILLKQIGIDFIAKTPDVSMLCIETLPDEQADMPRQPTIPEELLASLQSKQASQKLILKSNALLKSASLEHIEMHATKKSGGINSIHQNDPLTYFDMRASTTTLPIASEQTKDPVLRKV